MERLWRVEKTSNITESSIGCGKVRARLNILKLRSAKEDLSRSSTFNSISKLYLGFHV